MQRYHVRLMEPLRKNKTVFFILFFILLFQHSPSFSTVDFIKEDLGFALGKSHKEQKVLMIFFYADWCVWCKMMDEKVFANPKISEFSEKLVSLRLNAEKGNGVAFSRKLKVDGLPTVIFLDSWGKELDRINGYIPPAYFLKACQKIVENERAKQKDRRR